MRYCLTDLMESAHWRIFGNHFSLEFPKDYNFYFCVTWKCESRNKFSARRPIVRMCGEHFNMAIFSDTMNMRNVKLCMMVVLIDRYPFIPFCDFDCISRSQQRQIVLMKKKFLSDEVEILYDCSSLQVDPEHITVFDFRTCSREVINLSPCLENKKLKRCDFLGHC